MPLRQSPYFLIISLNYFPKSTPGVIEFRGWYIPGKTALIHWLLMAWSWHFRSPAAMILSMHDKRILFSTIMPSTDVLCTAPHNDASWIAYRLWYINALRVSCTYVEYQSENQSAKSCCWCSMWSGEGPLKYVWRWRRWILDEVVGRSMIWYALVCWLSNNVGRDHACPLFIRTTFLFV